MHTQIHTHALINDLQASLNTHIDACTHMRQGIACTASHLDFIDQEILQPTEYQSGCLYVCDLTVYHLLPGSVSLRKVLLSSNVNIKATCI